MSRLHPQDGSQIGNLVPSQPLAIYSSKKISSIKPQGSHFLNLLKPTRYPEASRKYVHGDPVALIDWKAFARSDQLIIREQRDEASARVHIYLDDSETMLWPTDEIHEVVGRRLPTKFELAVRIAFNLLYWHLARGDHAALLCQSSLDLSAFLPKASGELLGLFERFSSAKFSQNTFAEELAAQSFKTAQLHSHTRMPDLAYWLSDGLNLGSTKDFTLPSGQRTIAFHILSSLELDSDWLASNTSYFDNGGSNQGLREYQGSSLLERGNYKRHLRRWLRRTKANFVAKGMVYHLISDRTTITEYQSLLAEQ